MSATNSTVTLGLPLFVGTDKPAWLVDWNGAMNDIDSAVGTNQTDIASLQTTTTTQGSAITNLQTTVGNQTTSINTLINDVNHNTGDISTINSLIGNGTPTTTDHTIIGAINELHADQGDLADLTTSDKSSLVNAINEVAQGGNSGVYGYGSTTSLTETVTVVGTDTLNTISSAILAAIQNLIDALSAGEALEVTNITYAGINKSLVATSPIRRDAGSTAPPTINTNWIEADSSNGEINVYASRVNASYSAFSKVTLGATMSADLHTGSDTASTVGITGVTISYRVLKES